MDDFAARRELLGAAGLKTASRRTNAPGLRQLALHLGALAVTGTWIWHTAGSLAVAPAWVAHGVILNFLFAPLHETIHRTAFRTARLNSAVAWFAGAVLVLPPIYFRHFHFNHHRYTQIDGKDPELLVEKPRTLLAHLWMLTGLQSYWWPQLRLLLAHTAGHVNESFIPERAHREVIREARVLSSVYLLVIIASIWVGSWAPLTYWLVPVILGGPALRLFLHAEHTGCPRTVDMLDNTRTTLTNPFMRLLAWNMPYHVEHHLYPSVPFHALPQINLRIAGKHRQLAESYFGYHREVVKSIIGGDYDPTGRA